MTSKTYTNLILTLIFVVLVGLLFKGFFNASLEKKVLADDDKYKDYRVVQTYHFEVHKKIRENVKGGWHPISITQSQVENTSTRNITVLFAK